MKNKHRKRLLISVYHYLCFFLLMAFLITCCMLLFLKTLQDSTGLVLNTENTRTAAYLTFGNVVFLSMVCTVIDALRRKYTVDRHVKKIVYAADQIAKGDYSVRIPSLSGLNRADGLDKIADCFNKMASELSGIESMREDFISNVSHEIKTPLGVIKNYASLLTNLDITEEERQKYASSISEACSKMSELVSNILKLSKLENQEIFPKKTELDLSEQVVSCLIGFENIWEEKGIDIESDIDDGVYISTDPELLRNVWNNLLSNAFKFTEKGGKVSVSVKKTADGATVTVCDTGCGIDQDTGKHIFEKFYQGDTSHASSGNGLGLPLVKRIIDIVGADISVESEVGVGSTFVIRLKNETS